MLLHFATFDILNFEAANPSHNIEYKCKTIKTNKIIVHRKEENRKEKRGKKSLEGNR